MLLEVFLNFSAGQRWFDIEVRKENKYSNVRVRVYNAASSFSNKGKVIKYLLN